jgi:hypothetical protein
MPCYFSSPPKEYQISHNYTDFVRVLIPLIRHFENFNYHLVCSFLQCNFTCSFIGTVQIFSSVLRPHLPTGLYQKKSSMGRVLLQNLVVAQLVNPKVRHRVYKSPPLVSIQSQINPIHVLTRCIPSILIVFSHVC